MDTATATCKNCGTQFRGNYCNKCGEKLHTDKHKTISHLFEEAIHFLTHFDGNFFTTVKTIFTKPGQLSLHYCSGLRKKYFKPVSFFLLCIVVYLLFSPFQGLNMKFRTYLNPDFRYAWLVKPAVEKKLHGDRAAYEKLAAKYDKESPHVSKVFLLVLLPAMAALLFLLFFRKTHYYFDHFILATEFGSVWIAFKFIFLPVIMLLAMQIDPSSQNFFADSNWILWISIEVLLLVFLIIAFRRFYQQKWVWTVLKAIVFLLIFDYYLLFAYHILLFYVVMLFI